MQLPVGTLCAAQQLKCAVPAPPSEGAAGSRSLSDSLTPKLAAGCAEGDNECAVLLFIHLGAANGILSETQEVKQRLGVSAKSL